MLFSALEQGIQELHRKFVLVPADKSVNRNLVRDLFHFFLNKVTIPLFYVISKSGIDIFLDSMWLAYFLHTLAASRPKQTGNIVLDLKIFRHPNLNSGIKENSLVLCT